jgi:hypothetical protein
VTGAASLERRRGLHRRAVWLEYFTVGWNVIEGAVAVGAGIIAGSIQRPPHRRRHAPVVLNNQDSHGSQSPPVNLRRS